MVIFHNPALNEEPRNEPAQILPLKESEPLLNWLKRTDRLFKSHESDKSDDNDVPEELEDIIGISIADLEAEEEEEEFDLEE
jgi:hypothetical protein